jgi:hypothetical protein
MSKSKIFIASSGRTLLLAEKLRDELRTEFCEATLWSDVGKSQTSLTIIEMLEKASKTYDFAVIILARDDIIVKEAGDTLKARDNCVFEAGLFMAALGRERCFLVNSVEQKDLPSDLGGIISIPFQETNNLIDRSACAEKMAPVASILLDQVQLKGTSAESTGRPLSVDDLFQLEKLRFQGGDLLEGRVIVCDMQPNPHMQLARQVRDNIDNGVNYHYFLTFSEDTVEKICHSLQVMLVAGASGPREVPDFKTRANTIKNEKDRVLADLERMCQTASLRITLLNVKPLLRFRVHNADNAILARLYAWYRNLGYILWADHEDAMSVWETLPKYLAEDDSTKLFVPLKFFDLEGDLKTRFTRSLDRALTRYFPGIERDVKQFCIGTGS